MNKNVNVQKGKQGFQKTTPKAVTPTSTPAPPKGFAPVSPDFSSKKLNNKNSYQETYRAMNQLFRENEELLTQLTQQFEDEGMPTSDAQGAAQAEILLRQNRK